MVNFRFGTLKLASLKFWKIFDFSKMQNEPNPHTKTLTNSKIKFWILGHEMIENDPLIPNILTIST